MLTNYKMASKRGELYIKVEISTTMNIRIHNRVINLGLKPFQNACGCKIIEIHKDLVKSYM